MGWPCFEDRQLAAVMTSGPTAVFHEVHSYPVIGCIRSTAPGGVIWVVDCVLQTVLSFVTCCPAGLVSGF